MDRQDDFFSKCYIRASIGRGRDVIAELEKRGGKNLNRYRGNGDNTMIYYINQDGVISLTNESDDIGYLLVNSGWTELKLREPKKEKQFLVTVKEGNNHCGNCQMYSKCNEEQKKKCDFCTILDASSNLNGTTMTIQEIV